MNVTPITTLAKVRNAAIAAALTTIIVAILRRYITLDSAVEEAIGVLIMAGVTATATLAAGWYTRLHRSEVAVTPARIAHAQEDAIDA